MIFHIIFILEVFIRPISCKSDPKMVINTHLYIKLCILLILHMVNHVFYVMVTNDYV
jgi:hypothetical protein